MDVYRFLHQKKYLLRCFFFSRPYPPSRSSLRYFLHHCLICARRLLLQRAFCSSSLLHRRTLLLCRPWRAPAPGSYSLFPSPLPGAFLRASSIVQVSDQSFLCSTLLLPMVPGDLFFPMTLTAVVLLWRVSAPCSAPCPIFLARPLLASRVLFKLGAPCSPSPASPAQIHGALDDRSSHPWSHSGFPLFALMSKRLASHVPVMSFVASARSHPLGPLCLRATPAAS
jgi:hypothetical protein